MWDGDGGGVGVGGGIESRGAGWEWGLSDIKSWMEDIPGAKHKLS